MNLSASTSEWRIVVFRALGAACVVHGLSCSPDPGADPSSDADSAVIDVAAGPDAAVVVGVKREDAGRVDGASAGRDAGTGAAQRDAMADRDASPRDAGRALADASDASGADVDSGEAVRPASASPSAGCQKSVRPSGGRVSGQGHNYVFPAAYDGTKPFPLLMGFHAASNPIEQIENLTKGSDFEKEFVRAFPKSKGSAWDYAADIAHVLAMYDDLLANYCVDTQRVFATGHSSGAQLIVQVLTPAHKADADHLRWKAVAPVAASRYGAVSRAIPVMYIQGAHDNVRNSDGSDVVKEFTSVNACSASSQPYAKVMSCSSGGKSVTNGCIQYAGCTAPTVWCRHDDPQYGDTNHGWPCFATRAMYEFFNGLP